ncbi:2Fe-2S iron-sulfur cluster binding domain-containing protein [Mangrovicoccus sp. HB182678]|uniref:2Fe-2S iron-sulfur cluster binding domain-containing protein n=2 Tax=Mangrovicoccus algicola TaxID=2771008 RepID=A0A8J7CK14_9RHOB|nr:2Fe-2S iron-sulfur cluster binding domain-containing protein [Mangrovicoccus algicola]
MEPGFAVTLRGSGRSFSAGPQDTLLAAALRAGLDLPADCKSGFCGACRLRVISGAVAHPEDLPGLDPAEIAGGAALACQARALGPLVIEAEPHSPDLSPPVTMTARVLRRTDPVPGITRLWLGLSGAPAIAAGQYVNILLEDGAQRPFSVAAITPEGIELQIRALPGGRFTDRILPGLAAGDALRLELPRGVFRYRPGDFRPLVLAATGTGIAPLAAILAELAAAPEEAPPVALYWGMRSEADLYLLDDLARLGAGLDDFALVPVLSRGGPDWPGRRGHVQAAVLADFPSLEDHALYLCGNPGMIATARRMFLAAGASVNHLYTDSFLAAAASPA